MSNDFMELLIMVLFVNPSDIELSVCIDELGCGHLILVRVLRRGTIVFSVMYRSVSLAYVADAIAYFIIYKMVNIGSLSFGFGLFSDINIKAPDWLRDLNSLRNPAS